MKYILKPIFKFLAYTFFYILKILLTLLAVIIGYIVAIALSLWNFKLEKVDMIWLIKTMWTDMKVDDLALKSQHNNPIDQLKTN